MRSEIPLIAFFGPDGSGKSTVADLIEKRLTNEGWDVIRYHWRPRVLPSLKKDYSTLSFNNPNELKPRKFAASFCCYLYFFFDFLVAQWFYFKNTRGGKSIILYERYFFDILIHPRRYQLTTITWLGSFLSRFVRKPNMTFVLAGTSKAIHDRKPELSVTEIDRQVDAMSNVLPSLCNTIIIDTDKSNAVGVSEEIVVSMGDVVRDQP